MPVDYAHEYLRRKIENGVVEQWYYLRSELNKIKQSNNENEGLKQHIDRVLENGVDHKWLVHYLTLLYATYFIYNIIELYCMPYILYTTLLNLIVCHIFY